MIKFRASRCGELMTDSRTKGDLSETAEKYLYERYLFYKYGVEKDISTRAISKGLEVEEDSITLYSRVKKRFFKKNEERLESEYLTGTPDLYTGEGIKDAKLIIDIKSSWDIFTFPNARKIKTNKQYYWQLQAYMYLTGASSSILAYCLIDTPEQILNDEKRKLLWKMGVTTEDNEHYQVACQKLEMLHKYDYMNMSDRVVEIVIERNDEDIERLLERCKKGVEYINNTYNYEG